MYLEIPFAHVKIETAEFDLCRDPIGYKCDKLRNDRARNEREEANPISMFANVRHYLKQFQNAIYYGCHIICGYLGFEIFNWFQ